MKNRTIIILGLCLLTTINLSAQNFEYAMTQPALAGAKINDILVVDDRVYIAGGSYHEGSPLIIVFDTSGLLLNYKEFIPVTPERRFGYITDLQYDSANSLIQAIAYAATGCDFGSCNIYRWLIDEDLQKQSELEFPSIGLFAPSNPQTHFSDSIFTLSAEGTTRLYTKDFMLRDEVTLPADLYTPDVIIHQNELLAFNTYHAENIYRLAMDGSQITVQSIPQANQIDLFGDNLVAAGSDGVLRRYDPNTLALIDSLHSTNADLVEFHKSSPNVLEVAWHQKEGSSLIQFYTPELALIEEINLELSDEYKIVSTVEINQNLYHVSSHNKINYVAATQGLIPVLRKIKFSSTIQNIDGPQIKIVDVKLQKPINYGDCTSLTGEKACSVYDNLYYEFTVENTGNMVVDNFGQYLGAVFQSFCGGFVQEIRYFDNLALAPGGRMTFTDSIRVGLIFDAPNLNFYLVGPNHLITQNIGDVYTVEDISTAQRELKSVKTLIFYPNPSQDFLIIPENTSDFLKLRNSPVEIFTNTGQVIQRVILQNDEISIKNLASGLYYIRISNDKNTFLGSFVKTE